MARGSFSLGSGRASWKTSELRLTVRMGVCDQPRINKIIPIYTIVPSEENMTLVYRAPKLTQKINDYSPAPTAYSLRPPPSPSRPSPSFRSKVAKHPEQSEPNRKVGPGSYCPSSESAERPSQSPVFMSTIDRFKEKRDVDRKPANQFSQELNSLMRHSQSNKEVTGQVISIQQRREWERENEVAPQRLPSIPTQDHSYGYRYDQDNSRLIYNDSPKIMFAKRVISQEEDLHFQRNQPSLGQGQKCCLTSNVGRPSPELKHQLAIPNSTQYNPGRMASIKGALKHAGSTATSFKEKFNTVISKKEKLLLNRLSKDFKRYLPENISLEELQHQKAKAMEKKASPPPKSREINECFLAKENRFKEVQADAAASARVSEEVASEGPSTLQRKKEPFSRGDFRFKNSPKESIGPGSYDFPNHRSNSNSILQKEQRFKEVDTNIKTPGPGSYQPDKDKKQRPKVPFNHFVSGSLKEKVQNRLSSMENLYEKVGRHLNYINKVEKTQHKGSHDKVKKDPQSKMMGLARIQSEIKKVIPDPAQHCEEDRERSPNKMQPPHQHLYVYSKPVEPESRLGPGCYEIASSLEKKSFNQSPPPSYN